MAAELKPPAATNRTPRELSVLTILGTHLQSTPDMSMDAFKHSRRNMSLSARAAPLGQKPPRPAEEAKKPDFKRRDEGKARCGGHAPRVFVLVPKLALLAAAPGKDLLDGRGAEAAILGHEGHAVVVPALDLLHLLPDTPHAQNHSRHSRQTRMPLSAHIQEPDSDAARRRSDAPRASRRQTRVCSALDACLDTSLGARHVSMCVPRR